MTARLSLVVPGCCGPLPENTGSLDRLDASVRRLPLWSLLSRADRVAAEQGFHVQIAALFDLQCADGNFPYAALDLLGENGVPGDQVWIHADPVCMHADIDHAILFDAQSLQLAQAEADKLVAELNVHFEPDGIQIFCNTPSSWYLQLNHHEKISTHPLHDAVGRNVNAFMPGGDDASYWRRFMNEAQMLLHMSEINQQREARGHLPVNSLWLWGEGSLPAPGRDAREGAVRRIMTRNANARGLAQLQGIRCDSIPENMDVLMQQLDSTAHTCIVFDELFSSTSYGDIGVWQQKLLELHDDWLLPLMNAAMRLKLPLMLYPCHGSAYQLHAHSRLRLWRRGGIQSHVNLHG